jgi:murein DD-endopeptidase MepM/ murein hydrolase activator NlpD
MFDKFFSKIYLFYQVRITLPTKVTSITLVSLLIGVLKLSLFLITTLPEEELIFNVENLSPPQQLQSKDLNSESAPIQKDAAWFGDRAFSSEALTRLAPLTSGQLETPKPSRQPFPTKTSSHFVDHIIVDPSFVMDPHRDLPVILPMALDQTTKSPISSQFGYRLNPLTKLPSMHHGIDLTASVGTPIVATADGQIITTNYHEVLWPIYHDSTRQWIYYKICPY